MIVPLILSGLAVGLGRRVAGGAFQQWTGVDVGDLPARAFYGVTVAGAAAAGGWLDWWVLLLAPAILLGCSVGNFGGIGMGRSGNPYWRDFFGMLAHGVLSLAPCVALCDLLWWGDYPIAGWWFVVAGMLCPPLYELGWSATGKAGLPWMPVGFRGGSELGEFFWGCAVGVAAYGVMSV